MLTGMLQTRKTSSASEASSLAAPGAAEQGANRSALLKTSLILSGFHPESGPGPETVPRSIERPVFVSGVHTIQDSRGQRP